MVKYGELSTKKDNKGYFVNTLKRNIENSLKDLDHEIKYDFARMFIKSNEIDKCLERLKKIYGIHEIVKAYEISDNDIEVIKNELIDILKNKEFNTFKVETKRSDKKYPISSMEVSRILGGHI